MMVKQDTCAFQNWVGISKVDIATSLIKREFYCSCQQLYQPPKFLSWGSRQLSFLSLFDGYLVLCKGNLLAQITKIWNVQIEERKCAKVCQSMTVSSQKTKLNIKPDHDFRKHFIIWNSSLTHSSLLNTTLTLILYRRYNSYSQIITTKT